MTSSQLGATRSLNFSNNLEVFRADGHCADRISAHSVHIGLQNNHAIRDSQKSQRSRRPLDFGRCSYRSSSTWEDTSSVASLEAVKPSRTTPAQLAVQQALNMVHTTTNVLKYDADIEKQQRLRKGFSDSDYAKFSWSRRQMSKVVLGGWFSNTMLIVILVNFVLVIFQADQEATCYPEYKDTMVSCPKVLQNIPWLYYTNFGLLLVYTLEAAMIMYVERIYYFKRRKNWLDFIICSLTWLSYVRGSLSNFGWLRVLRIFRFTNHSAVKNIPELQALVYGFRSSMTAIGFGAALIWITLTFASLMLVYYVHPTNVDIEYLDCLDCHEQFGTVLRTTLTLFQQIVAGDSWGLVSIPNMLRDWKPAVILPVVHLIIGLGVMNLILAVIVDRALKYREDRKDEELEQTLADRRKKKEELIRIFETVDVDSNGVLDFKEIEDAYSMVPEFRKMILTLGLQKEDLQDVFDFLDENEEQEISYVEFCDALEGSSNRSATVLAGLARMNVQVLSRRVGMRLDSIDMFLRRLDVKMDGIMRGDHLATNAFAPNELYSAVVTTDTCVSDEVTHDANGSQNETIDFPHDEESNQNRVPRTSMKTRKARHSANMSALHAKWQPPPQLPQQDHRSVLMSPNDEQNNMAGLFQQLERSIEQQFQRLHDQLEYGLQLESKLYPLSPRLYERNLGAEAKTPEMTSPRDIRSPRLASKALPDRFATDLPLT